MKNFDDTIKLLNHIQENPEFTQRELVEKLDISLGKVNFLLKALAERGIIKLKKFKNSRKKRAYLYLLTPEGLKKKTEISRNFLKRKLEEYNKLKNDIEILKQELEKSEKGKAEI